MPSERLLRILARLSADEPGTATDRLCVVSAEITQMSGAGIMLMLDDQPHGSLCTTNLVSAVIEELQYTLGEGPCVDAHRLQRPVVEPDLADPTVARWVAFSAQAVAVGARAVFGFPVRVGGARMGALNLYRDRAGPLTTDQFADALLLADIAARSIISMQADAPAGALGPDLEFGTNFRHIVHQAAGMVAVQLRVSTTEALMRLRARAYSEERSIDELARDVVERRIRFTQPGTD